MPQLCKKPSDIFRNRNRLRLKAVPAFLRISYASVLTWTATRRQPRVWQGRIRAAGYRPTRPRRAAESSTNREEGEQAARSAGARCWSGWRAGGLKMHGWPPMAQAYVDFLKGTKITKYAIAINIRYKILSSPCPWTSYRKWLPGARA